MPDPPCPQCGAPLAQAETPDPRLLLIECSAEDCDHTEEFSSGLCSHGEDPDQCGDCAQYADTGENLCPHGLPEGASCGSCEAEAEASWEGSSPGTSVVRGENPLHPLCYSFTGQRMTGNGTAQGVQGNPPPERVSLACRWCRHEWLAAVSTSYDRRCPSCHRRQDGPGRPGRPSREEASRHALMSRRPLFGDLFAYDATAQLCRTWTGTYWSDRRDAMAQVVDQYHHLMETVSREGEPQEVPVLPFANTEAHIRALRTTLMGLPEYCRSFATPTHLLPLSNGQTLDLTTGVVRESLPADGCTYVLPWSWGSPTPDSPGYRAMDQLLSYQWPGEDDRAKVENTLAILIRGRPRVKSLLILIGKPNCGKTSLLAVLAAILGDQAVEMSATTIHTVGARPSVDGFTSASDLARLDGARLALFDEVPSDTPGQPASQTVNIRDDVVKRLVGSLTIPGRRIGENAIAAKWRGNVVAATNSLRPWSRLPPETQGKVAPLRFRDPPAEGPDRTLRARLLADIPGVVLRLLPALQRVRDLGHDEPGWILPRAPGR